MFIKIGNHFVEASNLAAVWTFDEYTADGQAAGPAVVVELAPAEWTAPVSPGGQLTFRCSAEALAAIRREIDAQLFRPRSARDDVHSTPCPAPEAAAPGADRPPRGGYF